MKRILTLSIIVLFSCLTHAQNTKKVACIGNSVTFGYGHANPTETSYPTQLSRMLGDEYEVKNFGHSGATLLNKGHRPYTQQAAYRNALEFAPDLAVIHLGLNDTDPRNWPNYRDEFISDYIALIDTFRAVNPDVQIWICRMTPIFHAHRRFKSGTREWFWQIQAAIEQVAKLANVGLIDLHKPLYSRPDLFADALHPNTEGAGIIAKTVYSAITGNYGGLSLPAIYTDGMVIQHDQDFLLKGTANAGSKVTAKMNNRKAHAITAADGTWELRMKPPKLGKKHELTIECEDEKIILKDIVAGEVWLCSGQSNMAWMLKQSKDAEKHISAATKKNIRIYDMKPRVNTDHYAWPEEELVNLNRHNHYRPATWQHLDSANISTFSAVAYHFGAMLSDSLGMPIGLICNAIGGAPAESFIDRKTLEYELPDILYNWKENDMIQDWCRGRAKENLKNAKNPLQRHPYEPAYLFETAIEPLGSYAIKGVIWYQGESNAHNVELYDKIFNLMIWSWVNKWKTNFDYTIPFYFVQLSSINRPSWPHFRNMQRVHGQCFENCKMVVSSDKGHPTDVHPRDKQPIGERLALQALYNSYNMRHITPSGPVLMDECVYQKGNKIYLPFEYADGLQSSDGEVLRTFEIADGNGLYYPADKIEIKDNTIILSSKRVKKPTRARYGWQPYTTGNLVNSSMLPASTFEVDINNSDIFIGRW